MGPETATQQPSAAQDNHLDQVTENMSQVNPDVIDRPKEAPIEAEPVKPSPTPWPKKGPLKDRHGREFDPAIHEVDETGSPRLNRDGFLAGKPGRPGKFKEEHQKRTAPSAAPEQPAGSAPVPDTGAINRRNTAIISTSIFIRLGMGVFGDEWAPTKKEGVDEAQELIGLFDNYYKSAGINDLPPGWALALGLIGYAAVRLPMPKTQSRMKIVMGAIKNTVGKFFGGLFKMFAKFKGVKVNASHVDSGDHGERKNDAGQEASGSVPAQGNSGTGA